MQSAVCEVAHKLGRDPKDFLLELIGPDREIDPKTAGLPADFWNYEYTRIPRPLWPWDELPSWEPSPTLHGSPSAKG